MLRHDFVFRNSCAEEALQQTGREDALLCCVQDRLMEGYSLSVISVLLDEVSWSRPFFVCFSTHRQTIFAEPLNEPLLWSSGESYSESLNCLAEVIQRTRKDVSSLGEIGPEESIKSFLTSLES